MSATSSSNPSASPALALASYLPHFQLGLIVQGRQPDSGPFSEIRPGVILLVDVSGFTALTERFAARGAAGAEELSGILNRYFGRVADLISAQGGDIVAFAGDSALAMWPGEKADLTENVLRATEAALSIQSELDRYEPSPGVVLRQRAGIGCGQIHLMELGGVAGRWQFVVIGDPIAQASLANHEAKPGEVLLSKFAAQLVEGRVRGVALASGLMRADHVDVPEVRFVEPDALPLTAEVLDTLPAYVLPVVSDRLRAGQEQWIAEFRTLSMLFLNLAVANVSGAAGVGALHQKLRRVQEILLRFEGTLYQFLMDDKGLTAVCAFGLPPLAHEDDPRRALEAAITLREELADSEVATSMGIASGTVFCGVYGSAKRRQYTTLGNTVNLAARLMQASGAGILCDEATSRSGLSTSIQFESKGEILVKGRSAPIAVFAPSRPSGSASAEVAEPAISFSSYPIVGRESERAVFSQAVASLIERGQGACIVVEGDAGIGKSRLLENFAQQIAGINQAGDQKISCWRAAADSVQQSTPYHVWRGVFREALQLGGVSEKEQLERILAQLSERKELLPLAPLLNAILPLTIPETATTAALEGQARAENTQNLLLSILKSAAASSALVLILEDAHWFDSVSWRLALLASQQVKPLLLVLSTRPLAEPPAEFSALLAMPSTQHIVLDVLDSDLALKMVCQRLGVSRVPPEVARFIRERAKGHPLFSEQLAGALRDAGLIQISDGQCRVPESATGAAFDAALSELRFPSTLEGVITSRLDRLAPELQLTVKVASVIGQSFSRSALHAIYPVEADRPGIDGHLGQAEKLDLLQHISGDGDVYAFRQAITQEVAYHSVPFAQRRRLHGAVADWYEREFTSDLPAYYSLLAHHWRYSEVVPKALHYCSEAGAQALRNNANQEAVRFLSEALNLDEKQGEAGDPNSHSARRAEWELQLGKAYVNWSKYIEGRTHLERGLRLLDQSVPAGNGGAAGALLIQVSRQCLHRAAPARYLGRGAHERESLLKFSRTFEALTEIYYLQDMSLLCLLAVFRSLNLAELAGSSPELARGYSSAGSLVGFMTLHKAANAYFELAEKISAQINDPASRAWVSLARAMYLAGVGQWELAASLLAEAMSINDRLGDHRRGDDSRIVLGLVQYLQGNFGQSLSTAEALYTSAGDRLDARCQAEALRIKAYNLVVANRMAELRGCIDELDSLRSAQVKFGGTHQKQDVHALNAIVHLAAGDLKAAKEHADSSAAALSATSNNFFDYLLERSALAEVYSTLLAGKGGNDAPLRTSAQRALKALQSYSRVFSIGRPLTAIHTGNLRWLEGKHDQALTAWGQALESATGMQAAYYQGLAHASLAAHLPAESPERAGHVREARELLARLNAFRDLAQLGDSS